MDTTTDEFQDCVPRNFRKDLVPGLHNARRGGAAGLSEATAEHYRYDAECVALWVAVGTC